MITNKMAPIMVIITKVSLFSHLAHDCSYPMLE